MFTYVYPCLIVFSYAYSCYQCWVLFNHECLTLFTLFTPVASCLLMITLVYLYLHLFARVYQCLLFFTLFTTVYFCLPVYHYSIMLVYLCFPMFTLVYLCLHLFAYVYHCLFMFTYVYSCLPKFTTINSCMFTYV